jgi:hypothetical protein
LWASNSMTLACVLPMSNTAILFLIYGLFIELIDFVFDDNVLPPNSKGN